MEADAYYDRIQSPEGMRYDVSALFHEPDVFETLVTDLTAPFSAIDIDRVAGLDALGLVLGTAVARELRVGFVPVRKGGKLPISDEHRLRETLTDYSETEKTLELDARAVPEGATVLVVDDWIETAAQMTAAVELVECAGGDVAGISIFGADDSGPANDLGEAYRFRAVLAE